MEIPLCQEGCPTHPEDHWALVPTAGTQTCLQSLNTCCLRPMGFCQQLLAPHTCPHPPSDPSVSCCPQGICTGWPLRHSTWLTPTQLRYPLPRIPLLSIAAPPGCSQSALGTLIPALIWVRVSLPETGPHTWPHQAHSKPCQA